MMAKSPSAKAIFLAERAAGLHPKFEKYTPDYAWRVARGERAGLTRSQARGHARTHKGEVPVSVLRAKVTSKEYRTTTHRIITRDFRYRNQIPSIVLAHGRDNTFSVSVMFTVEGTKERYYTESILYDQPEDELMTALYDGENGINNVLIKYDLLKMYANGAKISFDVIFRDNL